jgi:hypothetical protein
LLKGFRNNALGRSGLGVGAHSGIDLKARIAEVGGEALVGSSAEFAKLFEADAEKWRGVIRAANIKLG